MITPPVSPRHRGFTLLELVIAMGLLAILVGMVFTTARTSLALGNTIVETQNEEMLHQAFFELLNQRFIPAPTTFPTSRSKTSRSVSPGAVRPASPRPSSSAP
jgi:prepilin-type N-terminal cleavage/methylation domain-containing protein